MEIMLSRIVKSDYKLSLVVCSCNGQSLCVSKTGCLCVAILKKEEAWLKRGLIEILLWLMGLNPLWVKIVCQATTGWYYGNEQMQLWVQFGHWVGGKSNKCDQCNFSTSQTANLENHMKIHSGENPTSVTNAIFFQWLKQRILKII